MRQGGKCLEGLFFFAQNSVIAVSRKYPSVVRQDENFTLQRFKDLPEIGRGACFTRSSGKQRVTGYQIPFCIETEAARGVPRGMHGREMDIAERYCFAIGKQRIRHNRQPASISGVSGNRDI